MYTPNMIDLAHEQYMKRERREVAIKDLFTQVYEWGSFNIKADHNSPAFRKAIEEVVKNS